MTRAIGIEIGPASIIALAVDEGGGVVARVDRPLGAGDAAAAALSAATAAAREAGLPANGPAGLSVYEPFSSESSAIVDALRKSFRVPTAAASLGTAAVSAEAWCGAAIGAGNVICLLVGDRVAAGALVNGTPWTGAHGLAGSAAWLALNPVERQDYRQHGCLDAEISSRGIARRLAWRVQAGDLSRVVERAGGLEAVTAQHVFDGARANDGVAISVVRDTVRYIGMAIANLVAMFDPEIVVLGGEIAAAQDLLLEPVRQECQRRVSPDLAPHLRIAASPLGDTAAAIGAARLAALASP
jgi:glucokinase